jgi:starch-binding outer membrane protein, SusD/RagB family
MKRTYIIAAMLIGTLAVSSCKKYLDVIPNGTANLDDVWRSETNCQQFVNTLYSQRPNKFYGTTFAPDLLGGGDWISGPKGTVQYFRYKSLLYGLENPNSSYFQYMSSRSAPAGQATYPIYKMIRYCYLLLDNINKVPNISKANFDSWKGEAWYLIGFYHQTLLEYYGPIVLLKENINLNSDDQMALPRSHYDSCVNFIAQAYDEAARLLPATRPTTQLGYATSVAAKSYKARLLLMAASKQYNGNATDYTNFRNKDNTPLMSLSYDKEKWKRALDAAHDAITSAEGAGFKLYTNIKSNLSTFDQGETNYHDAFCEPSYNTDEFIDANATQDDVRVLQQCSGPRVILPYNSSSFRNYFVPTFDAVEAYYTKNGLPLHVDPLTKNLNLYTVAPGDSTALLNRNREPRFYASIGFDRGKMAFNNDTLILRCRQGELQGDLNNDNLEYQGCTGYVMKKYMHKSCFWNNTTKVILNKSYVFPNLRLAELYLSYAEADFEYNGSLSGASLGYLNKIRTRAGLPNFETSWAMAGGIPAGDPLREVLHQERTIELMMEGRRYSDVRRWGIAKQEMGKQPKAWNIKGKTQAEFYQLINMPETGVRVFDHPKTIWLAIPIEELNKNPNMVQNPGY